MREPKQRTQAENSGYPHAPRPTLKSRKLPPRPGSQPMHVNLANLVLRIAELSFCLLKQMVNRLT